jgi:meso-butanediol dehydrogenase / (S,S)-butanediol dehydrogenase / diacetyl reductase
MATALACEIGHRSTISGGEDCMTTLKDRTAIVTGGGQGIGKGIAMALARAGAKVAIFGRTESTLHATQNEIAAFGGTAFPVVGDVASHDDRERLVRETLQQFGSIDILVNNAALIPQGELLRIEEHVIESAWQAGPVASLMLMRLCHPHLKGGGCIINVSTGETLGPRKGLGIYGATKAALNIISRSAAVEWGSDSIRVNTIMPFGESDAVTAFFANESEAARATLAGVPLGRVGDPELDIGRAVVFLAGKDSGYLTGATLPLDGGSVYLR